LSSPIDHWAFPLRLIAATALLGVINAVLLPWESSLALMNEGGPIEIATVVFYYLAVLVLWTCTPPSLSRLTCVAVSIVLLAGAAREMDLHIALFGMSILKANFYRKFATGPQVAIALLIIFPVLLSAGYLAIRYGRRLFAAARRRDPTAVTITSFFVLLVLVKVLVRSLGMVEEIGGYAAPLPLRALQLSMEEPLEMLMPLLVVIAIAQAWRANRNHAGELGAAAIQRNADGKQGAALK
jgi:hypothetical protein